MLGGRCVKHLGLGNHSTMNMYIKSSHCTLKIYSCSVNYSSLRFTKDYFKKKALKGFF